LLGVRLLWIQEKDVETDPSAASEMRKKLKKAGLRGGSTLGLHPFLGTALTLFRQSVHHQASRLQVL
jgi:hypothetical protein